MSTPIAVTNLVYWLVFGLLVVGALAGLIFVAVKRGESGGGEGSFLGVSFKAASTTALVLLLSAGGIYWSVENLGSDSSPSGDAVVFGKVKEIEQLPPNPVRGPSDSKQETLEAILRWFAEFSEARFVIDQGSDNGITKGDWFATVSDPDRAKGLHKAAAGNLQDDLTALIEVVSVYPDETVGTLEEWAYDAHLQKVGDIPIPRGEEIDLAKRAPVVVDQAVAAVPRDEKRAMDQVDRWFQRAAKAPKERQALLYEQAHLRAADFLQSYPNGFFAGDVLWTKAVAQFELKRYRLPFAAGSDFETSFGSIPPLGRLRNGSVEHRSGLTKRRLARRRRIASSVLGWRRDISRARSYGQLDGSASGALRPGRRQGRRRRTGMAARPAVRGREVEREPLTGAFVRRA
jgi:hypothetical protein